VKASTLVKRRIELLVDHRDILEIPVVRQALAELTGTVGPVTVTFQVPGGGDWSGMDAPVDKENPVKIVIENEMVE